MRQNVDRRAFLKTSVGNPSAIRRPDGSDRCDRIVGKPEVIRQLPSCPSSAQNHGLTQPNLRKTRPSFWRVVVFLALVR